MTTDGSAVHDLATNGAKADLLAYATGKRFGTLVTANAAGRPSAVPCVFGILNHGGTPAAVIALDEKPKSVPLSDLARVRNIQERPEALLLLDDESEDWDQLRYVTIRGRAEIVEPGADGHDEAIAVLRSKYPQYEHHALETRPQIWLRDLQWYDWRAQPGTGGRPTPWHPRDLLGTIQGRRSVRAFRPDPVPREAIERAIAAAGWAPSPHGTQPWRFVVLESRDIRAKLADAMAATWYQQLALDGQNEAVIARRLANSRDRLITPPVLIVLCRYVTDLRVYPDPVRQAAELTMATQSLGAAAQNLLLSLYAEGLDAGWMCAPLFCPDVVQTTLGLPSELKPHAFFPVGYAAKDPIRRPRRSLDTLIARWL